MVLARKPAVWIFAALAATVYTVVFLVARSHAASANAGVVGLGAASDLTITVPLLYYFLLVRPGYASWITLVALFMAGARAAGFLLPASEQTYLHALRWLGVPLEIWIVVNVVRRRKAGKLNWAARLLAAEAAVFYYALFSWRARPPQSTQSRAFPVAQASGYDMFSVLLMTAVVVEGVPVHLLVHRWSPTAAWILTGIGIYSFLWMVALYRSLTLLPSTVDSGSVVLQIGFLWRAEFPRSQVQSIRRFSASDTGHLSFVVLNDPQWLIEVHEPVTVHGPLGRQKTVTRIAFAVDDPAALAAALQP